MTLDNQTKVLLVFGVSFILIYFLYVRKNSEGMEEQLNSNTEHVLPNNIDNQSSYDNNSTASYVSTNEVKPLPTEETAQVNARDYAPPESDWLYKKFDGRNKAHFGEYKKSSYNEGKRGNLGPSDWDQYFDHNNNIIGNAQTGENDKFLPRDETDNKLAIFKTKGKTTCGSNQNCEPEDLFDVDKYLPQEVNDDWFSVQPEPISVKNRHLINITKPIGVNTIGSSKKNASYDLRQTIVNPKFVTSPWLNSSIEPDLNIKPLF